MSLMRCQDCSVVLERRGGMHKRCKECALLHRRALKRDASRLPHNQRQIRAARRAYADRRRARKLAKYGRTCPSCSKRVIQNPRSRSKRCRACGWPAKLIACLNCGNTIPVGERLNYCSARCSRNFQASLASGVLVSLVQQELMDRGHASEAIAMLEFVQARRLGNSRREGNPLDS